MNFYQTQIAEIKSNFLPPEPIFRQMIRAKEFIESNFDDEICLDKMAREGNFSKFHFIRVFKNIYGKTPHQYLIDARIEKAKKLLKQQISVTETCFSVGFESVSSFTGLFKKMVGVTPSNFRNENAELRK
jgi:AraC-like DNA-binding protein